MKLRFPIPVVLSMLLATLMMHPSATVFAEIVPITGWDGHLFPSYIIATATMQPPEAANTPPQDDTALDDANPDDAASDDPNPDDTNPDADNTNPDPDAQMEMVAEEIEVFGDPDGLLGIAIEAEENDQQVTVTIACDAIMDPSTFSCTLPEKGVTYIINPHLKYDYEALARRTQTSPITVTYTVEFADGSSQETSKRLTLRSINDCPYGIVKNGKWTNIRFMFAAYVNEQHPFVDVILREALDTGIVKAFSGYQTKSKSEVYRQVYALWYAMSKHDVRYSSITKTVAASDTVNSQHVRLIDESINNGQANCVDGSVLFASLLRKIGIEPFLVLVPGHCYLAFRLDSEEDGICGLETTLIGVELQGDPIKVNGLEDVANARAQSENAWKTFTAAVADGNAKINEHAKEFLDPENQDYKLTSVATARRQGILPIGFQGK